MGRSGGEGPLGLVGPNEEGPKGVPLLGCCEELAGVDEKEEEG